VIFRFRPENLHFYPDISGQMPADRVRGGQIYFFTGTIPSVPARAVACSPHLDRAHLLRLVLPALVDAPAEPGAVERVQLIADVSGKKFPVFGIQKTAGSISAS